MEALIRLDDLNEDSRLLVMMAYARIVRERLAAERGIQVDDVPRVRFLDLILDGRGGYRAVFELEDGTGPFEVSSSKLMDAAAWLDAATREIEHRACSSASTALPRSTCWKRRGGSSARR